MPLSQLRNRYLPINIAHVDMAKGTTVKLAFRWSQNRLEAEAFSSKSGEIVYINSYKIRPKEP